MDDRNDIPVVPETVSNDTGNAGQPAKGLAIASLICGIASLVCCCFSGVPGIPAIILAIVAKKKGNTSKLATAGLVCGIIGLVLFGSFGIISFFSGLLRGFTSSFQTSFRDLYFGGFLNGII